MKIKIVSTTVFPIHDRETKCVINAFVSVPDAFLGCVDKIISYLNDHSDVSHVYPVNGTDDTKIFFTVAKSSYCHSADTFDEKLGNKIAEAKTRHGVAKIGHKISIFILNYAANLLDNAIDWEQSTKLSAQCVKKHLNNCSNN